MALVNGDVLLLCGKQRESRIIRWFQSLWAKDGKVNYDHAAVAVSKDMLFEATTPTIGLYDIGPEHYLGSTVKVFRCKGMTFAKASEGRRHILTLSGMKYPVHRLFLFALRLARFIHWKRMVCSEVAAKFLTDAGFCDHWWGVDVDQLHDYMESDSRFVVVFEGKLRDFYGPEGT